jgi:hypothetical protein
MASGEAIVDTSEYAQVFSATVLDREHALSLALTAIPNDAFVEGPPRNVEEVAAILRAQPLRTYEGPTDVVLPAILAVLAVDDSSEEEAADRIGTLIDTGDPLLNVEPSVRSFVEHFISAPIVPTEESRLSGKTLRTIIGGSVTLGAAAIYTGAGVVVGVLVTGGAIIVIGAAALAVTYAWSEYEKRKPEPEPA